MRARAGILAAALLVGSPAAAYEVAPVAGGATLRGVVRFAGRVGPIDPVPVTRDADACGEWAPVRSAAIGPGGAVRGAVVTIEGVARGRGPAGEVVVDSHGCAFVPPVMAAMAGTPARARNSDAVVHNPRGWLGTTSVFNVALPGRGQVVDITRRLVRPGVVRIACEVHPHMTGWLVVHDSPYLAVTDGEGAFRIAEVPPGTYTVTLWHPGLRRRGRDRDGGPRLESPVRVARTVALAPGATVTADFRLR